MKFGIFTIFIWLVFAFSVRGQNLPEIPPPPPIKIAGVEREIFRAEKYPSLAAVGRVNFLGSRWCSLTLVTEDIAISAGHCFLEANFKFDSRKDLEPYLATVILKPGGVNFIENLYVKRVLKANANPDFSIVRLSRKIPERVIKPLKISELTLDEMISNEERLGCAGFNGDADIGDGGLRMTISRNVKIVRPTSSKDRVDATCISTFGGSGGLFFEEQINNKTNAKDYLFAGVIWGLTEGNYDENGVFKKDAGVITSITPISAFYKELKNILDKNRKEKK